MVVRDPPGIIPAAAASALGTSNVLPLSSPGLLADRGQPWPICLFSQVNRCPEQLWWQVGPLEPPSGARELGLGGSDL